MPYSGPANEAPDEFLFTSESVTEGHPDKMADQISDAVLDALLEQDDHARVACEALLTTGLVVIAGEITARADIDIPKLVRSVIRDIGYDRAKYGFDADTCSVLVALDEQSPDIARGVDEGLEKRRGHASDDELGHVGAGDQGMMFGYASNETPQLMPLPIMLAHGLTRRLAQLRKDGTLPFLRPDGKAQVTVRYARGVPTSVEAVVVSTQHAPEHHDLPVTGELIEPAIREHVIEPVIGRWLSDGTTVYVNPSGLFLHGGPLADTGLTGRKVIVDTYGGASRHGGGAFSGKDPTKVDRSASYAARWLAKNVVGAGLADRCEVQVSYAIGVATPVSLHIEAFGTQHVPLAILEQAVREVFDLRPAAIIDTLDLRRPIYRQVATYGHFGRDDLDLPWEQLNRVQALQAAVERISNDAGLAVGREVTA